MKQVLKCDFCTKTAPIDEADAMKQHETWCSFNPANRTCYTCRNAGSHPHGDGDIDTCHAGHEIGHIWVVMDKDTSCANWSDKRETD